MRCIAVGSFVGSIKNVSVCKWCKLFNEAGKRKGFGKWAVSEVKANEVAAATDSTP